MIRLARLIPLFAFLALLSTTAAAQIRVACIGDSITYGARIADRENLSYPARLQLRLGEDYEVRNFGLSGRTLRAGADRPYLEEQAFQNAILWQPDIAIILLGTNDTTLTSDRPNWIEGHDFSGDLRAITRPLLRSNRRLRVILATSPKIAADTPGLPEDVVRDMRDMIPRLAEVRAQMRRYARTTRRFEFVELAQHLATHQYVDGYHPNPRGADHLAVRFATAIQSRFDFRAAPIARLEKAAQNAKHGGHHALRTMHFERTGHGRAQIAVLRPERALAGQPWVYYAGKLDPTARWYVDLADRGFHVVVADADRPWVTLPVEVAAMMQRAGFGEVIDGRALTNPGNPHAITRAALRLHGASTDEAYPTTRPRSGVSLGAATDWAPGETWETVSAALQDTAERIGPIDLLFLGGSTIQHLTGHRSRIARPDGERPFDGLAGPRRAAGFGVAGERTEHILWRIESGLFDQAGPGAIVLHVGAHNVIGPSHSIPETMDGIHSILEALDQHCPGAKVVVCTPLPPAEPLGSYRHEAAASLRAAILGDEFAPGVAVADTAAPFTLPDGSLDHSLSSDGQTLTSAGEAAFLGSVRPVLFPLLGH